MAGPTKIQCPHCTVTIFWQVQFRNQAGADTSGQWYAESAICPSCGRVIIQVVRHVAGQAQGGDEELERRTVVPRASSRPPCPSEVPEAIRTDYDEAARVLDISPKASAALSRRCLQHVLREAVGVKQGDLATEIDQVLASGALQSGIAGSLDAVRSIGAFAAHPIKSKSTGEIVDVEPGEAQWNLDVLWALFDVYYVQPQQLADKKAALNAKLADAGKPAV